MKKLTRTYELLYKDVFSQKDIRKWIVVGNAVEVALYTKEKIIFIRDVFVFLIEANIIRTEYLSRHSHYRRNIRNVHAVYD